MRFDSGTAGDTISDHKKDEENFKKLKVELVDKKLRRCKSNWLRHVTGMNGNRIPKIVLNYRPNGGRRVGRPTKRLLDETETGPSKQKIVTDDL
jgi:hypothetical protein